MEGQRAVVLLDIGNLKTLFGSAVGEIGVRVGGGTERGAPRGLAEEGACKPSVGGVIAAIGTENPQQVHVVLVVEK